MSIFDELNDTDLARDVVRDELEQLLSGDTLLTRRSAEQMAAFANRSSRTIFRWRQAILNPPAPAVAVEQNLGALDAMALHGADGFRFDSEMVTLLYLCGGNQQALRAALIDGGYDAPSPSTICRRAQDQIPLHIRDGAKWGQRNRYKNLLQIRHEVDYPYELAELDEFTLDIDVLRPGTRTDHAVCRPRACLIIDAYSRKVIAAATTPGPIVTADVMRMLATASQRRTNTQTGEITGGIPAVLRVDNGGPFRSGELIDLCGTLGIGLSPAAAYNPTGKGKVERVGQTIQDSLVTALAGRRTRNATVSGNDALATPNRHCLPWDVWVEWFVETVDAYNARPQSTLGKSPNEAQDGVGVTMPDAAVGLLWQPVGRDDGVRTVHPDGVHVAGRRTYVAPELEGFIGQRVQVRGPHHGLERLAVMTLEGDFICMVDRIISAEARQAIVADRIIQMNAVSGHQAKSRSAAATNTASLGRNGRPDLLGAVAAATGAVRAGDDDAPEPVGPVNTKRRPVVPLETMDPGPAAAVTADGGGLPDEAPKKRKTRKPTTTSGRANQGAVTPESAPKRSGLDLGRASLELPADPTGEK